MLRFLPLVVLLAAPFAVPAQDSGPGPIGDTTNRVYDVTLLQFESAIPATLQFSIGEPNLDTAVHFSGNFPGNPYARSGLAAANSFRGTTAPAPRGTNGGLNSPSVAAFVVNSELRTSPTSQPNAAAAAPTISNTSFFNSMSGERRSGDRLNTFFGLSPSLSGGLLTSGSLVAVIEDELLEGTWQAVDLGGYAVWFARAGARSSFSAWGLATPDTLIGSASLRESPGPFRFLRGGFVGAFSSQSYVLIGQAVDAEFNDVDLGIR